jgi:hypothetical protein
MQDTVQKEQIGGKTKGILREKKGEGDDWYQTTNKDNACGEETWQYGSMGSAGAARVVCCGPRVDVYVNHCREELAEWGEKRKKMLARTYSDWASVSARSPCQEAPVLSS